VVKGASQQPVGQGAVSHQADAVLRVERKHVSFHTAVKQVVTILPDIHTTRLHTRFDFFGFEVGHTDKPRLALLDNVVHGAHGLVEGDASIRPVKEIYVNIVSVQVREAGFNRELDPSGAAVAPLVAQGVIVSDAPFGDQNDVLPAIAKPLGEEPLGVAKAIPLGGVEAIDPEIQGTMDSADDFRVVKVAVGATQLPATETHCRYIEASLAKGSILHVILPTTACRPSRGLCPVGHLCTLP